MRHIALVLGSVLAVAAIVPAVSQPRAEGGDRQKLIGVWRLVSITEGGRVMALRGSKPSGYIFYTATGEMGALIQPERAPIAMAGPEPSPAEAQAALRGFTAYFGTYSVDEKAKVITHHRKGNVQPSNERDVRRSYRFDSNDRIVLGNNQELVWERVK
jgi:hypothetical protein